MPEPYIPQASPAARIARRRGEIDAAIARTLGGGSYVLGPAVAAFEEAFAAYLGVARCVGVASGADALVLALKAVGVRFGDEVITTALTAAATAQAILLCGAVPRIVDVDPETLCVDPAAVEAGVSPRTAAIVPVHLYGRAADLGKLCAIADKAGVVLVEDCAQAHGATFSGRKVGGFGAAAAFSFYPTKNLGGIGDGGAVVCGDPALAERVRGLRSYGWDAERICTAAAGNSRLDEIHAAVLLALLPSLDADNARRRRLAGEYRQAGSAGSSRSIAARPSAITRASAISYRSGRARSSAGK